MVQIGGVLQYKLEVHCGVSLLQSLEGSKAQRYKRGAYCGTSWRVLQYFLDKLYGLGVPKQCAVSTFSVTHNCQQSW